MLDLSILFECRHSYLSLLDFELLCWEPASVLELLLLRFNLLLQIVDLLIFLFECDFILLLFIEFSELLFHLAHFLVNRDTILKLFNLLILFLIMNGALFLSLFLCLLFLLKFFLQLLNLFIHFLGIFGVDIIFPLTEIRFLSFFSHFLFSFELFLELFDLGILDFLGSWVFYLFIEYSELFFVWFECLLSFEFLL